MFIYKSLTNTHALKQGQYYILNMINEGQVFLNACKEDGTYEHTGTVVIASSKLIDLVQKGIVVRSSKS